MSRVAFPLSLLLLGAISFAAPPAPNRERKVTLDMRTDNGPYKTSAYSFRKASADEAAHHNYVDLLLNKCGTLHVNMVTGQENRICDLGQSTLKDSPNAAPADAKWFVKHIKPEPDHVYLEEIKQFGQTMTVKFHVDEVKPDAVQLTWVTVEPLKGKDDGRRGAAGLNVQCGGPHKNDE
jgi:hypothetical protein